MESSHKPSGFMKVVIFALVLGLLSFVSNLYADWLWFKSVNYQQVFTIILSSKVLLYIIVFAFTFTLFFVNLLIAGRNIRLQKQNETTQQSDILYLFPDDSTWKKFLTGSGSKWLLVLISALIAFLLSSISSDNWIIVQQYLSRVAVGTLDPVFFKDISFYFFNLEFYNMVYSLLMSNLIFLLIVISIIYFINLSASFISMNWKHFSAGKAHIAIVISLIFLLKAWGYYLSKFGLLFSSSGFVYGATYTDLHARLLAYKVLLIISVVIALLLIINIFIRRMQWIMISIATWIVLVIILQGVYPSLMQKFIVQPNQFNKEKTNIERAIQYTRQAYNLDNVDNKELNISYDLNINDPVHKTTIDNIRLWDWLPLKTTYQNLQQLRPYYVFEDVDIDRYYINGDYRQLMLSAREIDQEGLPTQAKDWINQRLMYTHGYGVVASPVNEIAQEGFPNFFIKDVPPQFYTDLHLDRPEVYFGERTNSYVIVNTNQKEFNYPQGEQNVSTVYQSRSGIALNSFSKRLLFAWVLKDYKMLLSSDINTESQILMNRNVKERTAMLAPYLRFDSDPYIVITPEGDLFWVLDAYSITNKYPYSQPFDADTGANYIRNSVKVTCNAYSGEMQFYIADQNDPIIRTYAKIFPGFYKPLAEMPAGLKSHIRYPEDMFSIQADIFSTFHMTDPTVFYSKEDAWVVPYEIVEDKRTQVQPYYLMMRLPEETEPEYILMLPYSPNNRLNMVAWMCVRMDNGNYGKMLVYNFPKQETIYGPEQIESRINQDTVISQQLALWNQRGSKVYRGNLLIIPMKTSLLYVEPLYLQAENSQLPELKRVIVGYGNKIVMEPSLDAALTALFGSSENTKSTSTTETTAETGEQTVTGLIVSARDLYDKAQESIKEGNWQAYGDNLKQLDEVILKLEALSGIASQASQPSQTTGE